MILRKMVGPAPVQDRKGIVAKSRRIAHAANSFPNADPAFLHQIAGRFVDACVAPGRTQQPDVPAAMQPFQRSAVALLRHHDQQFVEQITR
jgi:hypothetical protein